MKLKYFKYLFPRIWCCIGLRMCNFWGRNENEPFVDWRLAWQVSGTIAEAWEIIDSSPFKSKRGEW